MLTNIHRIWILGSPYPFWYLYEKFIIEFLDVLHSKCGKEGKMPDELKKEVFDALNESEVKGGVKFTIQHLKDISFSVLKKYGPQE